MAMTVTNNNPTDHASPQPEIQNEHLDVTDHVAPLVELLVSMKASSPTHINSTVSLPDPDMKRLSAMKKFKKIFEQHAKGKQIVVLLDYDGTLSPIVENPDFAFMSDSMRHAVKGVAKYYPTAIITGRCLDKVLGFVQLNELFYAGSHGMDMKCPSGSVFVNGARGLVFQPARKYLPMINEICDTLLEKTKSIDGARVEDNKFCASVHYRCVQEEKWGELAEVVRSVLKGYPQLRLTQGRKVLEIRPVIDWNKGKALEFFLDTLGFTPGSDVFPVYIGDDRTDEDAFKVLREREQGLGILVSKVRKDTNASYYLKEPSEVENFLLRLVKRKRSFFYLAKALLKKHKKSKKAKSATKAAQKQKKTRI